MGDRDARPGGVKPSQANNAVVCSLFPDVESVSLDPGLIDTLAWFKEIS